MRRRLWLVLVCFLLAGGPAVAQQGETGGSSGNLTDAAYQDAVATAATPASYEQAPVLFQAIGAPIAFIVGAHLLFLLFASGIAGYWREDRFWAVYFLTLFTAIVLLVALPSLWIFF